MIPELELLFEKLWDNYAQVNPQAGEIHALLKQQGEVVVNDHIAFRTIAHPACTLEILARPFTSQGYRFVGDYQFEIKKLRARHLDHPAPGYPKIFISELLLDRVSGSARDLLCRLIESSPWNSDSGPLCLSGRPWPAIHISEYRYLVEESEYAAWFATMGFRANHFTVSVEALKHFPDLPSLNNHLKQHGIVLNNSGGEIKGSRTLMLEQSSTLAHTQPYRFADGDLEVPTCYYEFARRYADPQGQRFEGFLPESADKIFESTDRR